MPDMMEVDDERSYSWGEGRGIMKRQPKFN
jgi:hypothetical protein